MRSPSLRRADGAAIDIPFKLLISVILMALATAILFPVVRYVVGSIGLPWLYEAKRYSELWRQKFHNWIDTQYRNHGYDPDEAEAAGEALRRELEAITDAGAQKAWERFAGLLRAVKTGEKDSGTTVA